MSQVCVNFSTKFKLIDEIRLKHLDNYWMDCHEVFVQTL